MIFRGEGAVEPVMNCYPKECKQQTCRKRANPLRMRLQREELKK